MTTWPVLASLDPGEVDRVLAAGHRRRFARGQTLFHHGDPADALHLLDRGRVAVRAQTPQGDQAILSVLGPGSAFGELALVEKASRRTASVSALEECETIALNRAQFDRLRAAEPGIDRFLVAQLAAQVTRLSDRLLEVLFVPTRLRVIRQLLDLADEFDGVIPLTQEDIALMSGTTRPTVNEALHEFERTGAIAIGRRRIDILDRAQLADRLARSRGG